MTDAYDFKAPSIDGQARSLGEFRGQAVLIVNVASQCGSTPQYAGLEALYRRYRDQGLVVLGFPCDQFGHQEPGNEEEIKAFCSTTYDVTFPMFAKVHVNGDDAHPLYAWLTSHQADTVGGRIEWNFTKFLLDRDGSLVDRFPSSQTPEQIERDVAAVLT